MSDMKMYNILGVMKGLNDNAKTEQLNESVKQETVYENVEPRGSIMDAVKSLGEKYLGFKKTVTEASKPDFLDVDKDGDKKEPFKKAVKDNKAVKEAAKPDYIDLDKDGDKKEPMKKAAKDKNNAKGAFKDMFGGDAKDLTSKLKIKEGQGPYTLDDPKHPKFKANYEKYKKSHPDCKLADFVAAMRKKEKGLSEGMDDLTDLDSYQFADPDKDTAVKPATAKQAAAERRRRLQDLEDRKAEKDDWFSGKDKESNVRIHKANYQDVSDIDEVAPPGKKAERMVKHIKKGYADDGKLTKREKGIAYATAWKAKKAGSLGEATEFKDAGKIKNSAPNMKKAKPAMVKESRVMEETDYFYEKVAKALSGKNPNLDTAGGDFAAEVRKEMVAQGIEPNRARNILMMDEDFLSDVASSYGHYCKEVAESSNFFHNPNVPDHEQLPAPPEEVNVELDEIARLAGLPVKETDIYNEVNHEEPLDNMDEDAMGAAMGGVAGALVGKSPQAAVTGAKIGSALRDAVSEAQGVDINGKEINVGSIEVEGVNSWDRPDFADAYITYAEFMDGTPLSDEELVQLEQDHGDLVNQAAHDSLQGAADFLDEVTPPPRATPGKAPSAKATGMAPAKGNIPPTPTFNEDDVAEGNEFSGALAKAKASGAKEFEVDGKKYTVKEDINVNITANGQEDALNLFRKLAGMDEIAPETGLRAISVPQDLESALAQGVIEPVDEERDIEYTNTPNEKIAPVGAAIPSGTDLNRSKKQYKKEYPGDNPMAVKEEALWKSYQSLIKDVKA
jgi:hypothetical protein